MMGILPAQVRRMTVREIDGYARGLASRQRAERRQAAEMAWHTAALTRAKRFPALDRFLRRIDPPRKVVPKTPAQLLAKARQIHRLLGGK